MEKMIKKRVNKVYENIQFVLQLFLKTNFFVFKNIKYFFITCSKVGILLEKGKTTSILMTRNAFLCCTCCAIQSDPN